jgi:hypothetical protein
MKSLRPAVLSFPAFLLTLAPVSAQVSQPPAPNPTPSAAAMSATQPSTEVLSGALRGLLVQFLPGTLYDRSPGWGNTVRVANGLKWSGDGQNRHQEVQYQPKNDGTWRKIKVTADNLASSLILSINDVKIDAANRVTFTLAAWFDVRVHFEQQRWRSGVRLYSTSAQARLRVKLQLECEAATSLETSGALLPTLVLRLRVLDSKVGYDHLVFEHLAGMGGTGARWLGELVRGTVHELRPSLERKLLDRANAAILKAGDTREVRLGLGGFLNAGAKK